MTLKNKVELKSALRKQVLQKRDALAETTRIEYSLAAADHGLDVPVLSADSLAGGTIVAGFLPIRSEIDLRPLMSDLAKRGARLCLPVVLDKTTIIFREMVRGAPIVNCGFGTVGPDENAQVLDPDIIILPLSAFDRRGARMGYGAGHYDRAIERLINKGLSPRLIGMAFGLQQVDEVPMEDHDRFVEGVITESGFINARDTPQ